MFQRLTRLKICKLKKVLELYRDDMTCECIRKLTNINNSSKVTKSKKYDALTGGRGRHGAERLPVCRPLTC